MTRHRLAVTCAAAVLLTGCTAPSPSTPSPSAPAGGPDAGTGVGLRLVAFPSCSDALSRLKAAAREGVSAYGFDETPTMLVEDGARAAGGMAAPDAAVKEEAVAPAYSGTNTHEAGVDEPDVVKTDGRRIVTVDDGVLRIVDAGRRALVGSLNLDGGASDDLRYLRPSTDLLVHGDRALVLRRYPRYGRFSGRPAPGGLVKGEPAPPGQPGTTVSPPFAGTAVLLIDLAGQPRLLAEHHFDGVLLDARQVGSVARIAVRSTPRLLFPQRATGTTADRVRANKRVIDQSTAGDWLPRYETTQGGRTTSGQVPCDRISHPDGYSGTAMLTVLTFDLGRSGLGDGDPVTVVADGDTVYGTGSSLYIAADQRRSFGAPPARTAEVARTRIFKFALSGTGRPRYVAGGTVSGWLINQYAMSEWDGRLRVATTGAGKDLDTATMESGVSVLRQRGTALTEEGRVGGLGKGERIYSVRFIGPVGYVVTFRQTDPLYTVDLSDPARPRVTGELKISGYSAYLHPAGEGRLIGVGQEASAQGGRQGTQVSLFDVSDPAKPIRLARHHVPGTYSMAEYDPHAFLYWPADRLLALPVSQPTTGDGSPTGTGGILLLKVGAADLTERGGIRHDPPDDRARTDSPIQRCLVVDGVLWTLSGAGFQATALSTLKPLGWVAF